MKVSPEHRVAFLDENEKLFVIPARDFLLFDGLLSLIFLINREEYGIEFFVPKFVLGSVYKVKIFEEEPKDREKKYCFEVPTSLFLVRQNGKVFVTGNSGKSSGCVFHLFYYAMQQPPNVNGVRRTRYVIVRNTYRQLQDTTKVTIDEWLDPSIAKWKEMKSLYEIKFALKDGTTVESTWLLRALDNPDHVRNLLSLEVTGAWFNEAREIHQDIFEVMRTRIGRFPPAKDGGPDYPFIILDSNPPDTDHWLYKLFEEAPKKDPKVAELFEAFYQPSGLSPEAENIENLPPRYYEELCIGQDEDWIRVYVHGEYGFLKEGKPVFSAYRDKLHLADEELMPIRGYPLIIGMDFGLTPATVITQKIKNRLYVLDEEYTLEPTDLETFVNEQLIPRLTERKYLGMDTIIIGDPAGTTRSPTDGRTCVAVLRQYFPRVYVAWTNAINERIRAVNEYLTRMDGDEPCFKLSPTCKWLRQALNGKYYFQRKRGSKGVYSDVPVKNEYSHVADALQYAAMGYRPSYNMVKRPETAPGGGKRVGFDAFV